MISSSLKKKYQTIGHIQSAVSKADNFTEAIHHGLHIIIEECGADYASVWYFENEDTPCIRPNYWIGPVDFYSRTYAPGEGIIGRVYEENAAVHLLDYKSSPDADTDKDWTGIDIGSLICVPLSSDEDKMGVIQFIKTADHEPFSEEDADICEILSMMTAMAIIDRHLFETSWHHGKEIMKTTDLKKEFVNGPITTQVLKGINLSVYEGEFLVLLGESGCGKTTLLNILGGLDNATSGTVTYMGKDISNASEEELTLYRRNNIGFIFQSYNLMPNLNAEQNLNLIGELVDDPFSAKEVLALVGLEDKSKNYPAQLSGGQQQRISIARALIKKPRLILADEPTAALDYATSIEVLSVLEDVLAAEGTTLIMVTHNEEITKMADRVVRLRSGRIYDITVNRWRVPASELVW